MGSESRQKTQLIQVRATPVEKEQLKSRAGEFGISMGELCRQIVFGTIPKSKTDQQAILFLAAMRADLGRLGGLLKGWLAGSFSQSPPVLKTHSQVISLLHEIEDAQKMIIVTVKKLVDKS
jgi:hypothetical protein